MRCSALSRFAKMIILLAFLTGMQMSIAPMASLAAARDGASAIPSQCQHCDKAGTVAGTCHVVCVHLSAIKPSGATEILLGASVLWSSQAPTRFGRVVRPSLAPPRIS